MVMPKVMHLITFLVCVLPVSLQAADKVLFEDNFDDGLSSQWKIKGLANEDYRVKDGALELRVQPGKYNRDTPMLKVILPFTSSDSVTASVEVTLIDQFTEPEEMAGLFLVDENGKEFRATKQRISGEVLFSPPSVRYLGKAGKEDDFSKYAYTYRPATDKAGPLRIIVDQNYAYFQVGPSTDKEYLNFFSSAIRRKSKERGFCLSAAGAPVDAVHWVRFDNFRVVKSR